MVGPAEADIDFDIIRNDNDTFTVKYTPPGAGSYTIMVLFADQVSWSIVWIMHDRRMCMWRTEECILCGTLFISTLHKNCNYIYNLVLTFGFSVCVLEHVIVHVCCVGYSNDAHQGQSGSFP